MCAFVCVLESSIVVKVMLLVVLRRRHVRRVLLCTHTHKKRVERNRHRPTDTDTDTHMDRHKHEFYLSCSAFASFPWFDRLFARLRALALLRVPDSTLQLHASRADLAQAGLSAHPGIQNNTNTEHNRFLELVGE